MNCPQDYTGDIHCSPQAFSDYLRKLAACHKSINHTAEETDADDDCCEHNRKEHDSCTCEDCNPKKAGK